MRSHIVHRSPRSLRLDSFNWRPSGRSAGGLTSESAADPEHPDSYKRTGEPTGTHVRTKDGVIRKVTS